MSGKKTSRAKTFPKGRTICLQCGDFGYDLLIFCDKCKENAVHRYCLDRLPKTLAEDVVWFCDDCKPSTVEKQLSDEQPSSAVSEEKDSHDTEMAQPIESKWKPKKKKSFNRLRKRREKRKKQMQLQEKEKAAAARERKTMGKTGGDFALTAKVGELKGMGGTTPNIIDEKLCTVEGQDIRGELEKERKSEGDIGLTITSPIATPVYLEVVCSTEQAQPILDPVWRGSLSINSLACSRVGRVVAYASTLACAKVSEEAKLFPQLLCSDLYSRLSVWPKGFEKWGPTDESIALFLFPEDEKNEKVFESLLSEMMSGDFALKAVVTNAEFLIFTSIKLPFHLWKINGKFFLWGVFREKQLPSDSSSALL